MRCQTPGKFHFPGTGEQAARHRNSSLLLKVSPRFPRTSAGGNQAHKSHTPRGEDQVLSAFEGGLIDPGNSVHTPTVLVGPQPGICILRPLRVGLGPPMSCLLRPIAPPTGMPTKLGKPEKHALSEPTAKIWHGRRRAGGEAEVGL